MVGETDELHFARKISATTLQRDDTSGTLIHPKHIHKALRKYLGVADTADSQRFPFHNTEELPLVLVIGPASRKLQQHGWLRRGFFRRFAWEWRNVRS